KFEESDWSWVNPLVDNMVENPGWFRSLTAAEKEAVTYRMWAEGRLKVEPWLESRVMRENIRLWPMTRIVGCEELPNKDLRVSFDSGQSIIVDQIILATGYKTHVNLVPFLNRGNILESLETNDGFPVLDEHLQSNIEGLFFTSLPANRNFGPFFGFTIAVRTSA